MQEDAACAVGIGDIGVRRMLDGDRRIGIAEQFMLGCQRGKQGRGDACALDQRLRQSNITGLLRDQGKVGLGKPDAARFFGQQHQGEAGLDDRGPARIVACDARFHHLAPMIGRAAVGEQGSRRLGEHQLFIAEGEIHFSVPP